MMMEPTNLGHGHDLSHLQRPFPAVPPAMPRRLRPARFRSNRHLGDLAPVLRLLCQTPPFVFQGGLSTVTARPWWAQGGNAWPRCRAQPPIKPGQCGGSAARRRSQVRRVGKRPCKVYLIMQLKWRPIFWGGRRPWPGSPASHATSYRSICPSGDSVAGGEALGPWRSASVSSLQPASSSQVLLLLAMASIARPRSADIDLSVNPLVAQR
jgi:hypothetical protein